MSENTRKMTWDEVVEAWTAERAAREHAEMERDEAVTGRQTALDYAERWRSASVAAESALAAARAEAEALRNAAMEYRDAENVELAAAIAALHERESRSGARTAQEAQAFAQAEYAANQARAKAVEAIGPRRACLDALLAEKRS